MERLQRLSAHIGRARPATTGTEAGTAILETTELLTPWSALVRQRLADRTPLSIAKNAGGYPSLAIEPLRPHPYDPAPVLYARALGAKMWDIDGNEYLDFNNAFGPHVLGYNHPEVMHAVREEMKAGLHYNFPYTRDKQSELANILVRASPAIEKVSAHPADACCRLHVAGSSHCQ